MSTGLSMGAPPAGTFPHALLRAALMMINSGVIGQQTAAEVLNDELVVYDCHRLGQGLSTVIINLKGRMKVIDIPRSGNDNKEGVLGGVMALLGLSPKSSIGDALDRLANLLMKNGCSIPLISTSRVFKLPQIAKVNYMEYMSGFLRAEKPSEEYHPLIILLTSLGAIVSYLGRPDEKHLLYLLPGEDLFEYPSRGVTIYSRVLSINARLRDLPPTVKLVATASMVARLSIENIDHVADEYIIQRGNRFTVTNSYPMRVGFLVRALPKSSKLLATISSFVGLPAHEGKNRLVRDAVIKVSNYLVSYASSGNNSFKYLAIREVTALESLLRGRGKERDHLLNVLKASGINKPREFLASVKLAISEMRV